jgi:hypothetical protein
VNAETVILDRSAFTIDAKIRPSRSQVRTCAAAVPETSEYQAARRTAAAKPISAVPTSTIAASSRIQTPGRFVRWTAIGAETVAAGSSLAAGAARIGALASTPNIATEPNCLRMT